jgi:hypothetical protein
VGRSVYQLLLVIFTVSTFFPVGLDFIQPAQPALAATGTNQQINFQARLLNSAGATVPDGLYNMQFKVYQDGDGILGGGDETLKWTESWLNNTSTPVTVRNGYFSVYLGSINPFGSSVDFNQDTLWLSINVGNTNPTCTPFTSCSPDGEMSPFKRFASNPYSLNSAKLQGLDKTQFVQLGQGLQADTSSTASIAINKTGTGAILDLQKAGVDVATLSNTGAFTLTNSANSTAAFQVQNASGTAIFNVDTTNNKIGTPNSTTATTQNLKIATGDASVGTNLSSGNLTIDTGSKTGTGTAGSIFIGGTNAPQITLKTVSGANSTTLTFTTPTGTNALAFPDAGGTICTTVASTCSATYLTTAGTYVNLQASTPGTAQTGNLNLSGTGILGTSVATPLLTSSGNLAVTAGGTGTLGLSTTAQSAASTNSATTSLTTGNVSGVTSASGALSITTGNSTTSGGTGNITVDTGAATSGTNGTISLGGTNASALTLGRAGLQVSIPGGLTTNGSAIATANGNLTLGSGTITTTGTITSGLINGQTISSSANFTGTLAVTTLGSATSSTYLCYNSSNQVASCNTTGSGVAFVQGGNSFSAPAVLGTNDGNTLAVRTNGVTRLTLDTANTAYFGNGITNASPAAYSLQGTGGSGTDVAGAALTFAGGQGTGTGAGGSLIFATAPAGTTSATPNALVAYFTLNSAGLLQGSNTASISAPGSGTATERFGASATTGAASNTTAIGNTATATGGNSTALGASASATSTNSIAIGRSAAASTGSGAIAIGNGSVSSNAGTIAIGGGTATASGANSITIGYGSSSVSDTSVAIGYQAINSSGATNSIALGAAATTTAANQFVVGSNASSITNVYFGTGVANGTGAVPGVTVQGTGSATAGNNGAAFTLLGGAGSSATTGSSGGALTLQGGTSSGTAANAGGAVSIQGGTPSTTGVGGAISITSGAGGTTSGASGAISINTANATGTASNSGAIGIDVGTATGTVGTISIGTSNARAITIGNTSVASGSTSINSGSQVFLQAGSSGYVSLTTSASNTQLACGIASANCNITTQAFGGTAANLTLTTAANSATAATVTVQPGATSGASSNGGATTIKGGDGSGTTTVTGGALTLQGGAATGGSGTRNGGSVNIDAGSGATANGAVNIATSAITQNVLIGNTTGGTIRVGQNAGTLQLDGTNFDVSTGGLVTLIGGLNPDITTAGAATSTAITLKPGTSTGASSNGPATTISGGDGLGTTTVVGGLLTLQGGSATGGSGTRTGGGVTINAGTGATANGAINIGTSAIAQAITIGNTSNTATTLIQSGTGAINIQTQGTGGINIGTNAIAQTVTVGSQTGTSILNLQAGTGTAAGDINIFGQAGTIINVGANTVNTKTINIGSTGNIANDSTINIANTGGNATQLIRIGSTASANNAVLIQGGTNAAAVSVQAAGTGTIIVGTANANTVTIGSTNASTVANIQAGGGINIGTSSATQNITIGNGTGGTLRVGQNGGTVQIDGTNFDVATTGIVTLAGSQSTDITTTGAATSNNITVQPGTSTAATGTGASTTLKAGDQSGTTTSTGGSLTLQGGSATGASGTRNGGSVTIDAGTGATANGSLSVGTTNASAITIGSNAITTTVNGVLTVTKTSTSTTAATESAQNVNLTDTGIVTTGNDISYGQNVNVSRTGATGGTIDTYGVRSLVQGDAAGSGTSTGTGVLGQALGQFDNIYGVSGSAVFGGTASPALVVGVNGQASSLFASGTATAAYGLQGQVLPNSGATFTTGAGLNIKSAAGTGTVTNNYGINVEAQTLGTSDYGIRVDAADTQTLWISGNANNTTASAGIAFGSSLDTTLYRSAASTLKTDGAFVAGSTVNAITGYQLNGAAATGHYLRGNGTNYVDSAILSGDLPSLTGTYLKNVPSASSDNLVAPTANSVVSLQVKGTAGTGTPNILEVIDSAAVTQSYFDSTGALNTLKPIVAPTTVNTINGLIINSGALSGISTIATSSTINSQTISSAANFTGTVAVATGVTSPLFQTADGATASANVALRSGNTTGGSALSTGTLTLGSGDGTGTNTSTGAITVDTGAKSGTGTAGAITIGGTNASALTLGRAALQVSIPGGLTTNGSAIATANGNLTLGSGTITTTGTVNSQTLGAASSFTGTVTVATGYQIGGAAATAHYLRGNGTNYVDSAILAGDLPSLTGTYLRNVPAASSDNLIAPTANGVVSLQVKGTAGTGTPHILDVIDSGSTTQSYFDSTGALNTLKPIVAPTTTNTINGVVINSGALSSVTGYTQTSGNLNYTTSGASQATITSDLSTGARSASALNVIQGNDPTNDNSATLVSFTNNDTASTNSVLTVTQQAVGSGVSVVGAAGATGYTVTGVTTGTGFTAPSVTSGNSFSTGGALTSGNAYNLNAGTLTSGTGLNFAFGSTATALSTGSVVRATGTSTGSLGAYTGNLIDISPGRTLNAASTINDTGQSANFSRANTVTNAGGSFTTSGTMVNVQSSNCSAATGTCVDSAKLLTLSQNNTGATGDLFTATSVGTGNLATLTTSNTSGTVANGLLLTRGAAGTTTNGLAVTNSAGTTTNGLQLTQSGGTFTTGINFTGTFGNLIVAPNLTVSNAGLINGQTITSTANFTGTVAVATSVATPLVLTADGAGASANITVRSGTTTGGSALSTGSVTLASGDGSGTNTSSGAVTIDSGAKTGTGTTGAVNIGTTNATNINIGSAATSTLTNNGSTLNTACAFTDFATGGSLSGTTPTRNVNVCTSFTVNQTTASQTITVPSPTVTTAGRVIYVSNTGSTPFTLSAVTSITLNNGVTATLIWNGTAWTYAGADSSSLQVAYNNSTGTTTPEVIVDTTRRGFDIQDANTTLGSTEVLLAVRASATSSTLGTGLFVVNAGGKVGINTGSTSTIPTISYDLSFGQGANRTVGVEVQGTTATAGNNLTLSAGTGNTSGAGGQLVLNGGAGGATGAGGAVTLQGGTATAAAGAAGGAATVAGTIGATGNGATAGGAGGILTLQSGTGGAGTNTNSAGGSGAALNITAGNGGASTGTAANSNGGSISLTAGSAGTGGSGAAGTAGSINLNANTVNIGTANTSTLNNNGSTLNTACSMGNFASNSNLSLTVPTRNPDVCTSFVVTQTTASVVVTVPSPTLATAGRVIYVSNNSTSTQSFTLTANTSIVLNIGVTATLVWNGNVWTYAGADSSSLQVGYNNSAGAAPTIAENTTGKALVLQASATSGIAAGNELFGVRAAAANDTTLGASALTVSTTGVGIGIGTTVQNPTVGFDLGFGQIAGVTTARTIGVLAQGTAATGGNGLTVSAGTGNTSGIGGALLLNGGTGGNAAAGGVVTITGGTAGGGASNGGAVTLQGGTATTTGTGGLASVLGGSAAAATTGSAGGGVAITGAAGATGLSAVAGGAGGAVASVAGNGGAGTVTNSVGGAGGNQTITAGNGGNSTGTAANSNGGSITLNAGAAGTGGSGAAGTAGSINLNAATVNVGTANVSVLTNNGATVNAVCAMGNFASNLNLSLTTPTRNPDVCTYFTVTQTTAGVTVTVPSPTVATAGRIIYVSNNSTSTQSFTLAASTSIVLNINVTATLVWNGAAWTFAGADSSSIQVAYNNSTGGTTPEVLADSTRGALDIQDANTTLGANVGLLSVRGNATASTLGASLFVVNAGGKVGIGNGGTTNTNALSYDLSFGQIAGVSTARTIGVEAQGTTNIQGNGLTLSSGNGNGTAAGGVATLQGGTGGATGIGGVVNVTGGTAGGGNTAGGAVTVQGGTSTGTGTGGLATLQGGSASATAGSIGGGVAINGGAGAAGAGATAGGAAGALNLRGGNGGAGTGTNSTGANGAAVNITGGTGGAATGTGTNGNGGALTFTGGTAGFGGSTGTPTGGSVTIQGGSAAAVAGSLGGAVFITGGNGSGTGTGAAGSNITLQAGNAGGSGNNNGGNLQLTAGGATGSGVPGVVLIDTPVFTAAAPQSIGTTSTITQSLVDNNSTVPINATATGLTITIPTPLNTTTGRIIYITAVNGSNDFTLQPTGSNSIAMKANSTATLVYNGTAWTAAGADASTSLQQVYNNTTTIPVSITTTSATKTFLIQAGQTFDSSTLFQVNNSQGASTLTVDTTNTGSGLNLVPNSGGETAAGFTTTYPATGFGSNTAVSQDVTAGEYASGAAGINAAITPAAASAGVRVNLGAALAASTTHIISFSVKYSGTAWANSDVLVNYYRTATGPTLDTGGGSAGVCSSFTAATNPVVNTTNFIKYTCVLTTSSTAGAATAFLVIGQTASVTRNIFVDNLSIVAQTAGTANAGSLRVGGTISQGLNLLTLDSYAAAPFTGTTNTTLLGSIYYDTTIGRIQCYEADGWGACGSSPDNSVNLVAEYPGAVLNGTGIGTMTANLCSGTSRLSINTSLCAATEDFNYYQWTSPQTGSSQTYSIYVRYQLPATFSKFKDLNTVKLVARTSDTTNGSVAYAMYQANGTQCGSTTTVTSSNNTWQQVSMTGDETLCTFAANDIITFRIDVTAKNNALVYASNLTFTTTGL